MRLEAINLIGVESGVKAAHRYWDIFKFVMIENCMDAVQKNQQRKVQLDVDGH